jgi:Tol biopolymer transport system component
MATPPPEEEEQSILYTVDVATGREELLARDAEEPAFSPDGRWVAFADRRHPGISRVRLDGSRRTRIFRGSFVESLDWSPGGRSIAFRQFFSKVFHENGHRTRRYYTALRVVGVRSGHVRRLVRHWTGTASLAGFSWSPTGRRLLVSTYINERSREELFMVGARSARVVPVGMPGSWPAWQPLPTG